MAGSVNISVAVDVVAALSGGTPDHVVFLTDDSPLRSEGKGTSHLVTACLPGQVIRWTSYAMDVQTPLSIRSVRFAGWPHRGVDEAAGARADAAGEPTEDWHNDSLEWSGIVPWYLLPGLEYRYTLTVQMGTGPNALLSIDTSALKRVGG